MARTLLAGSGRRGIQRSGIKEEPAGRGTAAELSATPSGVLAYTDHQRAIPTLSASVQVPVVATTSTSLL